MQHTSLSSHHLAPHHRLKLNIRWRALCVGLVLGLITPLGKHAQPMAQIAVQTFTAQQPQADSIIMAMHAAYKQKDSATVSALFPQARGHLLEPWAAYWDLNLKLSESSNTQIDAFLQNYAGTYQEDRLRNDWLLELGQRGDWANFARYYPQFRMRDDNAVRCYAVLSGDYLQLSQQEAQLLVQEAWFAKHEAGSACNKAAQVLYQRGLLSAEKIWHKVWLSAEKKHSQAAANSAEIIAPELAAAARKAIAHPKQFLDALQANNTPQTQYTGALAVTALAHLARVNHTSAAQYAQALQNQLSHTQSDWTWAMVGKWAVLDLDPNASRYFQHIRQIGQLPPNHLAWMTRSALRSGDWAQVRQVINAMPQAMQHEPIWTYWKARSLQNGQRQPTNRPEQASKLLQRIAGYNGFYELLALEELNGHIGIPKQAHPLTDQERHSMRSHAGLQRALYARMLDLGSEARREWNYSTNLHLLGGMNDRDLYAAADLACQYQWWDRCINTSERSEHGLLLEQRFPTPYLNAITRYSNAANLDPSWVLGLIRQESRFIHHARSHVGAGGLMQVMPDTARLIERKMDIAHGNRLDVEHNIQLGTSYLSMMHNTFGGSMAMASAAYNAGPARPKKWREGPPLEGAIWAETIPFAETRGYVKKVLANSVLYALRLHSGKQQSLYQRLGRITPAPIEDLEALLPNTHSWRVADASAR